MIVVDSIAPIFTDRTVNHIGSSPYKITIAIASYQLLSKGRRHTPLSSLRAAINFNGSAEIVLTDLRHKRTIVLITHNDIFDCCVELCRVDCLTKLIGKPTYSMLLLRNGSSEKI